ncbi:hypothetical protein ACOMHN_051717 [Nucella lapillus]
MDTSLANRRKSAVELLAASRPQYVKSAALLDPAASAVGLTAGTPDRHYRSIFQPRERPPVRSKSEFDVSKLHELLAQEDDDLQDDFVDGCHLPREKTARRLSEDLLPISALRGREGEEEEERHVTSLRTSPSAGEGGGGRGGGKRKINIAPDRQDESQRFFPAARAADVASTSAFATTPPSSPPPSSLAPPPSPPVPSSDTQSAAPALYTARPIYINLRHPTPPSRYTAGTAASPRATSNAADLTTPTPVNRSIRVFSAASRFLSPSTDMSEESLDKTPTNPTGGDLTPGGEEILTPAQPQEEEKGEGEDSPRGSRERGGSVPSATSTPAETARGCRERGEASPQPPSR